MYLAFIGCQKERIIVNSQLVPKIIVNGYISDQFETQQFDLFYSSNINDTIIPPVLNAKIVFEQLGNTYQFTSNDSGIYTSTTPFSCLNGEKYSIKYDIDTSFLEMSYDMPESIQINELKIDSLNFYLALSIDVYSPTHQYVILKVTDFFFDSLIPNNTWVETVDNTIIPIYEIQQGQNELLISNNDFSALDSGRIVKIEASAISTKTAKYFMVLRNYYETIATSSLYVNPPHFYPNEFYGITYGLSTDTISVTL